MLKVWNVTLITITYVLTLFGTFLVRSGVLTSVHAFGDNSLGRYFLVFTVLMLVGALILIAERSAFLTQGRSFKSFLSKESSFLMNNLVLVGLAFAVFLGTTFPLISEAVRGVKVSVGAPFFNTVAAPLGLALFILMGICPLIAWRKATGKNLRDNFLLPAVLAVVVVLVLALSGIRKPYALAGFGIAAFNIFAILREIILGTRVRRRLTGESYPMALIKLLMRNRRRHGGYIIHLGMVLMLISIIGSNTYNLDITKSLKLGETIEIGSYKLSYDNISEKDLGNSRVAVYADLSVYDRVSGRLLGGVEPQKVFYPTSDQPTTEIGLRSTLKEDLYTVLADWQKDGSATFKIFVNPLVSLLWLGGYVVIFGTILALWPGRGNQTGARYLHTQSDGVQDDGEGIV